MIRLLLLLTLLANAVSLSAQAPEELVRWVAAQKTVSDIQSTFRLTRSMPTLKEPVVTQGKMQRLRDDRFRVEIGQAPATLLLYDGKQMHIQEAGKTRWNSVAPTHAAVRMWTLLLNSSQLDAEALAKDFAVTVTQPSARLHSLTLTPRSASMKRRLTQLQLMIHVPSQRPQQMSVTQADGTLLTLDFDPPQPLSAAAAAQLQFTPPTAP
jgi:outer membrane lipoprotein-sorting protein